MESANAVIFTVGKSQYFQFDLLYYPLIKWMVRSLEDANISEILIVCDNSNSYSNLDFSEFSCKVNFIYLSEFTSTTDAFKDAAKKIADFDGTVLVFDAPMPVLSNEGLSMLIRSGLSYSESGVYGEETLGDIRVLCADNKTLRSAFEASSDFSLAELARFYPSLSFVPFDGLIDRDDFKIAMDMPSIALLEKKLKHRVCQSLLESGVYIQNPDNTIVSPTVKVAPSAKILMGSILYGETSIGKNAIIGPNTLISSSTIGSKTTVNASQIYESSVGEDTKIGPFAYIRPGCIVGNHIKVGDFVELKKSVIGDGTKISHLTYIGDAEVGENVNFGCGTVTVNYDGNEKYLTRVEDNAFIGCNTNLVAPVTIHRGAYTAAGTTITEDVPEDALAIGRCRETIKENWVSAHRVKK
ncbi:MAG: UDP-N-acetylglucosamine diphosphorylase [Clostridiales bacterium]|nr:UDP-N-acetylglucosamine diphosphorylase [Clostridiales bacterium]